MVDPEAALCPAAGAGPIVRAAPEPGAAAAGAAGAAGQATGSVCEAALASMRSRNYYCAGELKEAPEDYGTSALSSHLRYLPADYGEAERPGSEGVSQPRDGTMWAPEFHHACSLSVGDVQKQLPKPEKLKDLVKYRGPASRKTVMKQAATNSELQKAVEARDADRVAALLRFGVAKGCVNVNAPLWPKRECVLHLAARRNCRDICTMLLEARAELHAEEITDGRQPLHDACSSGSYDVVELLLDKRARIEENTFTGMRPMHWAASRGHDEVLDLLLDRRARIDTASGNTWEPLHHAASEGHATAARLLCRRGAGLEKETGSGQRPIHLACLGGHVEAAAALADFGALGVMGEFGEGGPLRRWRGSPLDQLLRRVEELRFLRDEAEELHDMGQRGEAEAAFREVCEGYTGLGLEVSASGALEDAARCGIVVEPSGSARAEV